MKTAISKEGLYSALLSKDSRFDGKFFVGISSTGIYCRPTCRAKTPKIENCTFFETAAEAEQAAYRPCLLCRPELAPGKSIMDARFQLARRAARLLEEDCSSGQSVERLAGRLGCTDRHLRRVFADEYHITPLQYLQTCRLLFAKSLLTDTTLSIASVAQASGFGSLRRFNDLFKKHYRMTPSSLRNKSDKKNSKDSSLTVFVGYRPPYRWDEVLEFLKQRAILGVETVADDTYLRAVRHVNPQGQEVRGWIQVAHNQGKNALSVTVSESLLSVLPQVLARVRRLFDLYCEPKVIFEALAPMNDIKPDLCVLGTRVPGCYDEFEMATRAILGQQITVKAASTLAARMVKELGTPLGQEKEGVTHLFPSPSELLSVDSPIEDTLGSLGIIASRARTIEALARSLSSGEITLDPSAQAEEQIEKLMSIKGIGSWTAQYIAMRTMEWPDSFLETDVGVKHALAPATPKEMLAMAEPWRPWRSYATLNLWNSLARAQG